ncbi:MAG: hypothetical protein QW680_11775 [Pyrobaculum sp.]
MKKRLTLAVAIAAALIVVIAAQKIQPPKVIAPINITHLAEIIRSNPQLYEALVRYLAELGIETPTPPVARPTNITIELNQTAVLAGSAVLVKGRLTAQDRPLSDKIIAIYLDGRLAAYAKTDSQGEYKAVVKIDIYKPQATIKAEFKPLPNEFYRSSNATATIKILYYNTEIRLNAPKTAVWGDEITIQIAQYPPVQRKVAITAGAYTTVITITNSATIAIPTSMLSPGAQQIVAYAEPAGPYAPAANYTQIIITAEKPQITLLAPRIAIAGAPIDIKINVTPPLQYSVYIGGRSFTNAVPIETPTGPAAITVKTKPSPPYAAAEISATLYVINILQLAPLTLIPIIAVTLRKAVSTTLSQIAAEVSSAAPRRVFTLIEQEVITLLAHVFYKLGERSGRHYQRKMTYREYAKIVEKHAFDPNCLKYVVELAERTFYSPITPTPIEMQTAWICAQRL